MPSTAFFAALLMKMTNSLLNFNFSESNCVMVAQIVQKVNYISAPVVGRHGFGMPPRGRACLPAAAQRLPHLQRLHSTALWRKG